MDSEQFGFGEAITGLATKSIDATAPFGATLRLSTKRGLVLEVPFIRTSEGSEPAEVGDWFTNETPPRNLMMVGPKGPITLFELQWSGLATPSGLCVANGALRPQVAVFAARECDLAEPLTMDKLFSRVDGLNHWTDMKSIRWTDKLSTNSRIEASTLELRSPDPLQWSQGNAKMSIRSNWRYSTFDDGAERHVVIRDNVVLESAFDTGQGTLSNHLKEQRKVTTLMAFLFGKPVYFREHRLRDELIVSRTIGGRVYDHPAVEVISAQTYRDRLEPVLSMESMGSPLATLEQIGAEGLQTWAENFDDWDRFILPAVGVLAHANDYVEDTVISTAMSIEAAGHLIGKRGGEERTYNNSGWATMTTYVYRCLDVLSLTWPEGAGNIYGLSRAISANYRTVKHFDTGSFPDFRQTLILSEVNELIVRFLAIRLTGRDHELLEPFRDKSRMYDLDATFRHIGLSIDEDGNWHASAE